MRAFEKFFDKLKPKFEKGGKLEKFYAFYEAADTFILTPPDKTKKNVHIADSLDFKRTMIMVAWALLPCVFMAMYNSGYQANLALHNDPDLIASGWRAGIMGFLANSSFLGTILGWFGASIEMHPGSFLGNMIYGALFFLPAYIVTMTVGGLWEALFAATRGHEINEGFVVSGLLFPLTLPASIPLWQVAVGISFGVVIGKEVFGGTGKNIFNPALTARVFLFFAYPAQISGDAVWTAVDGHTGATALSELVSGGVAALSTSWSDAFWGFIPGSMGETSTLACLFGAAVLIATGIGSWRIMLSCTIGMILTSMLLNSIGSETNQMMNVPWSWHFVLGSFAFATVFMATDPVSATQTTMGKWVYGFLIGCLGLLVRAINPAYPEGWMLAILFMNAFAPLIDWFVLNSNVKRRQRRA